MDSGHILVIDDDPALSAIVTAFLGPLSMRVDTALSAAAGLAADASGDHDVVLLDLDLHGSAEGLEVLRALRKRDPVRPVIMLTANTTVASVVLAMRDGAWDYLSKPIDRNKLGTTVRNAVERRRLLQQVEGFSRLKGTSFHGIVGGSALMGRLFSQIERVARSDVTVAIHGESGSGKELVARAVHDGGPRKDGPFVAVNCAAIHESLQESEFFGHEKGAFTGAATRRIGRMEQADGGTLFLDEVAELSLTLQAKLLRSLQERRFSRLGGTTEISANFRLLSATHKDLAHEVAAGRFREDLFYRLAVFEVAVPPLRERPEDIPLLANHFLQQQCLGDGTVVRLEAEALEAIVAHRWPGNVRELQNAIYHSLVLANDGVIRLDDLPERVRRGPSTTSATAATSRRADDNLSGADKVSQSDERPVTLVDGEPISCSDDQQFELGGVTALASEDQQLALTSYAEAKRQAIGSFERHYLTQQLRLANGNISRAAELAGLDRSNFRRLCRSHGVEIDRDGGTDPGSRRRRALPVH
jgi:DNA-binding NtrC family response regulator